MIFSRITNLKPKGNMAINQVFLLVLAILILVVLVGASFVLGDKAHEMIGSIRTLIPIPKS